MLVMCSIGCTSHQSLILYIVAINTRTVAPLAAANPATDAILINMHTNAYSDFHIDIVIIKVRLRPACPAQTQTTRNS